MFIFASQQNKWITKWKTKNTTLSEHFQNVIEQIVERGKLDTSSTQIYDHLLSCLGIGTSMKKELG